MTLPLVWALVVEPAGARTKRSLNPFAGWRETGVWTRQTCTWLVFVFCYGLVQQHLDNEYIAYVPLIVAFSLIAAFVVAGRPFLTRPYAATTKVGAAESC